MEIPELVIDKEGKNLYHVYLFYIEEKWWAFGYSAYYLSIMYPILEATSQSISEHEGSIPCVRVPDNFLANLSDYYTTLVSDTYIQVDAPPTAYCYRKEYDGWRMSLTVN